MLYDTMLLRLCLRLRSKTEPGCALAHVEDGVHSLEEDIAEDAEADAGVGLNAAKTSRAA